MLRKSTEECCPSLPPSLPPFSSPSPKPPIKPLRRGAITYYFPPPTSGLSSKKPNRDVLLAHPSNSYLSFIVACFARFLLLLLLLLPLPLFFFMAKRKRNLSPDQNWRCGIRIEAGPIITTKAHCCCCPQGCCCCCCCYCCSSSSSERERENQLTN